MTPVCKNCGALLEAGNVYCLNCGTSVIASFSSDETPTVVLPRTQPSPVPRSWFTFGAAMLAALGVVFAFVMLAMLRQPTEPPRDPIWTPERFPSSAYTPAAVPSPVPSIVARMPDPSPPVVAEQRPQAGPSPAPAVERYDPPPRPPVANAIPANRPMIANAMRSAANNMVVVGAECSDGSRDWRLQSEQYLLCVGRGYIVRYLRHSNANTTKKP